MSDDQQETIDESIARSVTDNDREARYRRNIRNAQENASVCAKCGRQLVANDPVWRDRLSLGPSFFGGWRTVVAPVCSSCKPEYEIFEDPRPCEGCGRLVHNLSYQRHTLCSEVCRLKARAAHGRTMRREARGSLTCIGCGKTFVPTRTDALYSRRANTCASYARCGLH
jgi:hypothetical protein